jgi:putative component of toxin-antitoxin plasmid stabilization module
MSRVEERRHAHPNEASCGGDKRKQAADVERALEYLKDYKDRSGTS